MTDKRRAEKTVRDIRRATRRHFIFFLLVGPDSSLVELIGESLDGVQMTFSQHQEMETCVFESGRMMAIRKGDGK